MSFERVEDALAMCGANGHMVFSGKCNYGHACCSAVNVMMDEDRFGHPIHYSTVATIFSESSLN